MWVQGSRTTRLDSVKKCEHVREQERTAVRKKRFGENQVFEIVNRHPPRLIDFTISEFERTIMSKNEASTEKPDVFVVICTRCSLVEHVQTRSLDADLFEDFTSGCFVI